MAAMLSACATLDLGTALRYRNTGWEDVDVATARAAVSVPPALADAFAPSVTVKVEDERGLMDETFALARDRSLEPGLPRAAMAAGARVWGLAQADVPRARRASARAEATDASPSAEAFMLDEPITRTVTYTTGFTFSGIDMTTFCGVLDEPVRVWARRDADDPFRPLTRRRSVRQAFGTPAECDTR